MKLSVAITTHDEEKAIEKCLTSVYDWVDEIVVVDGESTDKTVDLIKKFDQKGKIRLYHEKNPPMFHINKQKAIEKCHGDWILQLDADEVVPGDLKNEILSVVNLKSEARLAVNHLPSGKQNQLSTLPVAYWIPRLNYFLSRPLKKGGQYPDYIIRLYKNGAA